MEFDPSVGVLKFQTNFSETDLPEILISKSFLISVLDLKK